jgi:hypothetical protein
MPGQVTPHCPALPLQGSELTKSSLSTVYSTAHPEYVEPEPALAAGDGPADAKTEHKEQPQMTNPSQFGELASFSQAQGFLMFAVVLIIVVIFARRRRSGASKEKVLP